MSPIPIGRGTFQPITFEETDEETQHGYALVPSDPTMPMVSITVPQHISRNTTWTLERHDTISDQLEAFRFPNDVDIVHNAITVTIYGLHIICQIPAEIIINDRNMNTTICVTTHHQNGNKDVRRFCPVDVVSFVSLPRGGLEAQW